MNALADFPPIIEAAVADSGPIEFRKDSGTAIVTFEQFAVAPLEAIRAGLVALANRYDRVAFDLTTPKGLEEAKAARHDLRENGRYAVQRAGEKFKKDANAAKKKADALVIELAAIVEPVEDRLDKIIKAREAEIEREKEAKRQAEEARKQRHRAAIDTIRAYLTHAQQPGMTSERIARGLSALGSMPKIGPETFEEFADEAAAAYTETFNAMRALHERVLADEMRAAEVERQRVENERNAREQAERQAALDRQAAEIAAERQRLERERAAAVQQNAPADEGNVPLPAAAGAYASSEPQAAQGSPSGDEGTGAHAEERAPGPPTLNTGAINARLGITLTSAFITGTLKVAADGASKQQTPLWREAKFRTICAALAEHVLAVGEAHA